MLKSQSSGLSDCRSTAAVIYRALLTLSSTYFHIVTVNVLSHSLGGNTELINRFEEFEIVEEAVEDWLVRWFVANQQLRSIAVFVG